MRYRIIELMARIIADSARKPFSTISREVAISEGGRRQAVNVSATCLESEALIIEEEECLVSSIIKMRQNDRATYCEPKIVLGVDRPL